MVEANDAEDDLLVVLLEELDGITGTRIVDLDDVVEDLGWGVAKDLDDDVELLEPEANEEDLELDVKRLDDVLLDEVRRDELRLLLLNELDGILVRVDLLVKTWAEVGLNEILAEEGLVDDRILVEDAFMEISLLLDLLVTLEELFKDNSVVEADLYVVVVRAFKDDRAVDLEESFEVNSEADFWDVVKGFFVLEILADDFGTSRMHLQAFLTAGTFKSGIGESRRSLHVKISLEASWSVSRWLTKIQRKYRTTRDSGILCW
jgi:hypothetical protein